MKAIRFLCIFAKCEGSFLRGDFLCKYFPIPHMCLTIQPHVKGKTLILLQDWVHEVTFHESFLFLIC
jgi:hypothetical protein